MPETVVADVAAALISGGEARRLDGRVKALIEIEGQTILQRQLDVLRPRFDSIVIAANDPAPYRGLDLPIVPDSVLGQGPLAGIAAALRWCSRPYVLAVAGDMPHLDGGVIELLLSRRAPGIEAVVPFVRGRPEPLMALYARRCLAAIERRLASGSFKASGLLIEEGLRVCRVNEPELRRIDPALRCLANVNSAADLP